MERKGRATVKEYNELDFVAPGSKPAGYLPAFLGMDADEWRDFFTTIKTCSERSPALNKLKNFFFK